MPEATRPWQHVIEPLFGYILLVQKLCSKDGKKNITPTKIVVEKLIVK